MKALRQPQLAPLTVSRGRLGFDRVDDKSRMQAPDRTQPIPPIGPGYVEEVTHAYVRHDTTALFAAVDTTTGAVMTPDRCTGLRATPCKRRNGVSRTQESDDA